MAAYVLLAGAFAGLMFEVSGIKKYALLATEGRSVGGRVIGTECQTHQSFRYAFEAQGHWYQGRDNRADKACAQLAPGDALEITYLPEDPNLSAAGDIRARLRSTALPGVLVALLLPLAILLRIRARKPG
jgi:hypothetical protein